MNITTCIFDLDGVIVDTAKYHFQAWRRLANELGFDFTEKQNEQLKGVSRMDSLKLILGWGNKHLSEAEMQDWAARKNDWYLEFIDNMPADEILPGVREFIAAIKQQGIRVVLGSASKNSVKVLKGIALYDAFDAIIDGTKTTKGKPDPQVFQMGAAAVGEEPAHCIVFEDAQKGVEAAKAGGFWAIGVGSPHELKGADYHIQTFEGLTLDFLKQQLKPLEPGHAN